MNKQKTSAQMDLEIEINGFETWEDFDQIANFIKTRYKALLVQEVNGPDARIRKFLLDDVEVLLSFDDMAGTFIKATNEESFGKIKELVKEIEIHLESVE